jgi:hypothetical protein
MLTGTSRFPCQDCPVLQDTSCGRCRKSKIPRSLRSKSGSSEAHPRVVAGATNFHRQPLAASPKYAADVRRRAGLPTASFATKWRATFSNVNGVDELVGLHATLPKPAWHGSRRHCYKSVSAQDSRAAEMGPTEIDIAAHNRCIVELYCSQPRPDASAFGSSARGERFAAVATATRDDLCDGLVLGQRHQDSNAGAKDGLVRTVLRKSAQHFFLRTLRNRNWT